jgi:hypothetical protein
MDSPIFYLQPPLFIAAVFQFCVHGNDEKSILLHTSRLSHGPFSSETFLHYCFGEMRIIHPYAVDSSLYNIITVTHYFVFHVICDLFSTCLIFDGVKSLIRSLPHRLQCV